MTSHETYWYPDPIPGFDVLKWKQKNQARILRETAGMTDEEIRERFRQASERATIRRLEPANRRAAENQT
jgi:benzoyl-CoA reductase/2-hydroxyglutaryl-CoA dehydratase subunit BcrC/BadD/HgdB